MKELSCRSVAAGVCYIAVACSPPTAIFSEREQGGTKFASPMSLASATSPTPRFWGPFENPVQVPIHGLPIGAQQLPLSVEEPFVSRDGTLLFFNTSKHEGAKELHFAERIADEWHYVGEVGPGINSPDSVQGVASLDDDGNFYYIESSTPWMIRRGFWSDATRQVSSVTDLTAVPVQEVDLEGLTRTGNMDFDVSSDGNLGYFSRVTWRLIETGDGNVIRGPFLNSDLDTVRKIGGAFQYDPLYAQTMLGAINTTDHMEYAATTSTNGLEIFFTSAVTDDISSGNLRSVIMRSTRSSIFMPFSEPEVIDAIGSGNFVEGPTLTPDGRELYYHFLSGSKMRLYKVSRDPIPAGTLDESFSDDGIAQMQIGPTSGEGRRLDIRQDGVIGVAGFHHTGSQYAMSVAFFKPDGSEHGQVVLPIGSSSFGYSIKFQGDGRAVVVGNARIDNVSHLVLARLNHDLSFDPTFGDNGIVLKPTVGNAPDSLGAYELALQSDGRIIASARNMLARFLPDGTADHTFNDAGIVEFDFSYHTGYGFRAVAVQPDGKILAAGKSFDGVVVRYNQNGTSDLSFGTNGQVNLDQEEPFQLSHMALQADGGILLLGRIQSQAPYPAALLRLNSDGSFDSTFKGSGLSTFVVGGSSTYPQYVAVGPDGRIWVGGKTMNGNEVFVARLRNDGLLDSTFGNEGVVTFPVGISSAMAWGLGFQQDAKVVVSGESQSGSGWGTFVARLFP